MRLTTGRACVCVCVRVCVCVQASIQKKNLRFEQRRQTMEEGTQLTVLFLGKPVFIRRRTQVEIDDSEAVALSDLVDEDARNPNLEAGAEATNLNRTMPDFSGENTGEWLVQIGVCTHLGCVPLNEAGDYTADGVGGWFCPCHGSHYDTAGRIRRGPAPENLHIPRARFVEETTILLG